MFTDLVLGRRYPEADATTRDDLTGFSSRLNGDREIAATQPGLLGVNSYLPSYARAAPFDEPDPTHRTAADIEAVLDPPEELPATAVG